MIRALSEAGFQVRSKDQDEEFKNNFRRTVLETEKPKLQEEIQKEINAHWGKRMENIETPLSELGFQKSKNEEGKTETADQFAVRVVKELHNKYKKLESDKSPEIHKERISELENSIKEIGQKTKQEKEQFLSDYTAKMENHSLGIALSKLPFNSSFEESTLKAIKEVGLAKVKDQYSKVEFDENFRERLYDDKGNLLTKEDGTPHTFESLLKANETLSPFLSTEEKNKGTGGSGKSGSSGGNSVNYPRNVKTKYDFDQELAKMNLSKEDELKIRSDQEVRKFYAELPIS